MRPRPLPCWPAWNQCSRLRPKQARVCFLLPGVSVAAAMPLGPHNSKHIFTSIVQTLGEFVKRRVLVPYFSILMVLSLAPLLLVFGSATHAQAQAAKGSVRGQVTDPSGAVIPNASVSLTTPDGHTVGTVTSNAGGSYQVNNLTPGTYIVIANAQGFASSNSKAISVGAGQMKQ